MFEKLVGKMATRPLSRLFVPQRSPSLPSRSVPPLSYTRLRVCAPARTHPSIPVHRISVLNLIINSLEFFISKPHPDSLNAVSHHAQSVSNRLQFCSVNTDWSIGFFIMLILVFPFGVHCSNGLQERLTYMWVFLGDLWSLGLRTNASLLVRSLRRKP